MTMITPSYLGETIEYSSLHACRSTLEDPTGRSQRHRMVPSNICRLSFHHAEVRREDLCQFEYEITPGGRTMREAGTGRFLPVEILRPTDSENIFFGVRK